MLPATGGDLSDESERLRLQLDLAHRRMVELEHQRVALAQQNDQLRRAAAQAQAAAKAAQAEAGAAKRSKLHKFFAQSPAERSAYVRQGMEIVETMQLELDAAADDSAAVAPARRLKMLMGKAAEFEVLRNDLDRKLEKARDTLIGEFEEKADKLFGVFAEYRVPHDAAFDTLGAHMASLLDGALLDIVAPSELDNPVYCRYLAQQEKMQREHRRRGGAPADRPAVLEAAAAAAAASGGLGQYQQQQAQQQRGGGGGGGFDSLVQGRMDRALSRSRSGDQAGGDQAGRAPPSVRAAARAQAEAAAASEAEAAAAQRRATAADVILPLFPHLELGLAVQYLELYGDSVERTMVALLKEGEDGAARDPRAVAAAEAAATAAAPPSSSSLASAAVPLAATPAARATLPPSGGAPPRLPSSAPGTSDAVAAAMEDSAARAFVRWLASLPRLVVRVEGVLDSLDIEFRVLRDRNGCAIDPELAPVHTISATALFYSLGCRFLDEAEMRALEETLGTSAAVPVVTYRPHGATFSLIDVRPSLPLSQYRMEYAPETGEVEAVYHQDDGPILFTAYCPERLPSAASSQFDGVVEVYHSGGRVAHAHLMHGGTTPHAADLLSVRTAADRGADVTPGTYAVVLHDGAVADVLYRAPGAGAAPAAPVFFVERHLPSRGDLVTLDGSGDKLCIARVLGFEGGLTAKGGVPGAGGAGGGDGGGGGGSDSEGDEAPQRQRYRTMSGRVETCRHAHPARAQGIVHLQVLVEHGQPLRPPRSERIPVCRLRTAFDSERAEFERVHGQAKQ